MTALLFSATPALASRPHEFAGTFGAKCLVAGSCTESQLFDPAGVAVNEATGDVYVVDKGEGAIGGRVVVFNAKGVFQFEINGSETPAESFETPETIAIDNSCVLRKVKEPSLEQAKCETEDPSNGDVYVVDAGEGVDHRVVDKFTAGGEYVGQISEETVGGVTRRFSFRLHGVAVELTGSVWIYQGDVQRIIKYSNAVANEFIAATEIEPSPGNGTTGFAIDSKVDFYVHYRRPEHAGEPGRVAKVAPTGKVERAEVVTKDSTTVAVDQLSDDPYICNLTSIAVLNSEGTMLEELGEHGELGECAGIGLSASADTAYVSDAAKGDVAIFTPAQASAPKVESQSVAAVTSTSASLAAQINPRSEEGEAPTEYYFQYGRCASINPASCEHSGYEAQTAAGQIPADFALHTVETGIEGLQADTIYHFRTIARNSNRNSNGEGEPGPDSTFTTQGAGGELTLPDNRGWELASPPNKQGALIEPIAETGIVQAAADGSGITYLTNAPTEASPQGYTNEVQVLSSRGAGSWSSRDIAITHGGATGLAIGGGPEYKFFSSDLDTSVVQQFGAFLALSEEASEPSAYLHELNPSCGSHCFHPLVTGKPPFANVEEGIHFGEGESCPRGTNIECGPKFLGASEDLSHVVLVSSPPLQAGEPAGELYEWTAGALAPVSVLAGSGGPAGENEARVGFKSESVRGAISSDGSRVEWSGATTKTLYTRDTTRGETLQLDNGEGCAGCASSGGRFQIASADGSRVFFTDEEPLSEGSGATPGAKESDLYECHIPLNTKLACQLKDLTPKHGEESANVQGGVLGASEDGSYVYFVATGVLSEEANERGQKAKPGEPNLYVSHEGTSTFIATLSSGDEQDWSAELPHQPTRVSGNGQWLTLMSQTQLSGYDNRDATSNKPVAELYTYNATTKRLVCASCLPSGERPSGIEYKKLQPGNGGLVGGPPNLWPQSALVGANVPGWTAIAAGSSRHQPRYLTNEGRLFFDTAAALVPQDANGTQDVYEYDPLGVKGPEGEVQCEESTPTYSARSGGCVALISSGSSAQESAFMDASESGDDVFFLTSAKLSPLDSDKAFDVYDAHVCSAGSPCIAYPNVQSPPCTTEASCKASPTPQPSIFGAPSSATFQGIGNTPPPVTKQVVKKTLTRAQKLKAALKACQKRPRSKRAVCRKQARAKYGPVKRTKKKAKR